MLTFAVINTVTEILYTQYIGGFFISNNWQTFIQRTCIFNDYNDTREGLQCQECNICI